MVAHRYGQRPSDLIEGDLDRFGFDAAVAMTAIFAKKRGAKPLSAQEKTPISSSGSMKNPNPMEWFRKIGTTGWNAGRN